MDKVVGVDGGAWVMLPAAEYYSLKDEVAVLTALVRNFETRLPPEPRRSIEALPEGVRQAILRGATPIAAWRKYRRMSQAALAAAAGVSAPAMHYIERAINRGRPATRQAIASALDVPLCDLDAPQRPRPNRKAVAK